MARAPHKYRRITVVGDSFTRGLFASRQQEVGGTDYMYRLLDTLQDVDADNGAQAYIRGGESGGKLSALAVTPSSYHLEANPQLITIEIGQNDYGDYTDDATFRGHVETVLDYIADNHPAAHVIVIAIPIMYAFTTERKADLVGWNDIWKEEAEARYYQFARTWEWTVTIDGKTKDADCPRADIASIVGDGSTATVNTSTAHGFTTGDTIIIDGTDNFDNAYDGVSILVTGANLFTFASSVTATETPAEAVAAKPINAFIAAEYNADNYHPNDDGHEMLHDALWSDAGLWMQQAHRRPVSRDPVSRDPVSRDAV